MLIQPCVCKRKKVEKCYKKWSKSDCLLQLRTRECLAYHYICGVFRAQGQLTPEKLKLLKEIAAALYIPDDRHRAECRTVANDDELQAIAQGVTGVNTDREWIMEGRDIYPPKWDPPVCPMSLRLADSLRDAIKEAIEELKNDPNADENTTVKKRIRLHKWNFGDDSGVNGNHSTESNPNIKTETDIKKEETDGESSSSISTSTEPSDDSQSNEEDKKTEEPDKTNKKDPDTVLMPPPPPAITDSSPTPVIPVSPPTPVITAVPPTPVIIVPSTTPVITVPPPTSVITVPPPAPALNIPPPTSVITVPPSPPVITVPPPTSITVIPATNNSVTLSANLATSPATTSATVSHLTHFSSSSSCSTKILASQPLVPELDPPILSESDDVQFVSFSESFDSTLPPLVVVPPAEPVITVPHASSFSPPVPTSTLVLPSGMSIQLREDNGEIKKRKRSLSQESGLTNESSVPKKVTYGHMSKVTPVLMSATAVSSQGQVKVTPVMSGNRATVTSQASYPGSQSSSTQKVIIVSNPSSSSGPVLQRSINMPMGMPIIRASQPRLQPAPALVQSTSGLTKLRPKIVTVPAKCRTKSSPLVIPIGKSNLQLKNTITVKQDNVAVVDTNVKRLMASGPAKILPKPQGSMFIVNPNQAAHKIATSVGQTTRMISPRTVSQMGLSEGASSSTLKPVLSKQNVVIVQKGSGNQRALTLTNTSKDLMQKLMSKKCVVIQSPKVLPKNISSKPHQSVVSSTASNVVVLDLSQEQYRQNINSTTIAEILQASGIITSPGAQRITSVLPQNTSVSAPEPNWLPVEDNRDMSLEEVILPAGQSESIVSLDKAVELLGEGQNQHETVTGTETISVAENSQNIQMEVEGTSEQIFTISPEELAASEVSFMPDQPLGGEPSTSQIVIQTIPPEVVTGEEGSGHAFLSHKDGAVTIQHSNIDMPANMSLEEYSSQQLENQGMM